MFDTLNFLYVEDDPHSRNVMKIIMNKSLKVRDLTIFEDSNNFMARLRSLQAVPDVIMLDIHVHPFDGLEMLKMIRSDPVYEQAKVIALTASVMNEEVEELRTKGFDSIIGKPVRVQLFPDLINRIIHGEPVWAYILVSK